jgi:hypothetical protein
MSVPVGSIQPFVLQPDRPLPDGWFRADGRRLYRREDPELYKVLRRAWHSPWRPWVVHIPSFNYTNDGIVYLIKGTAKSLTSNN